MLTVFLMLAIPAPPPPTPDLETERARIAVQVAIAIAKAKEVKPAPKAEPVAPAVATQPPFTQAGDRTTARRAVVPNTGFPATYRTDSILTPVPSTERYGVIRCVSYG